MEEDVFPNNLIISNILFVPPVNPVNAGGDFRKKNSHGRRDDTCNTRDTREREDLKICDIEFDARWIEIKNTKIKNLIVGCIYRHPHSSNLYDFMNYVSNWLTKLNKENRKVFISGDFNIDLLKYETNNKFCEFYNLMTVSSFFCHK